MTAVFPSFVMHLPDNFSEAIGLHKKTGPITSLHIFDFDGTLVRSPGPDEGKQAYFLGTGTPWKGGWWGRPGSLKPPVVDSPFPASKVVKTVFDEMESVITRSQSAIAVVVTGRLNVLRPDVLRILDEVCISRQNDTIPAGQSFLHHDAVFTNPGGRLSTLQFKMQLFKHFLTSEPVARLNISDVHIWEDRQEHAQEFATTFAEEILSLTGTKTSVHYVPETLP